MKTRYWRLVSALAALALAFVVVPSASAQCGLPLKLAKPASWQPQYGQPRLLQTALTDDDRHDGDDEASIVGFWHVVFTARTSNGSPIPDTIVDNALAVWHSDKTEIMNSIRPPQDGNFCMGVWERTGRNKYHLNHYAWFANQFPTDPPMQIGPPVGPTHIVELVTLSSDGKQFSGAFTLDAYDTSGNIFQSFTGVITGRRITTSTKPNDLF